MAPAVESGAQHPFFLSLTLPSLIPVPAPAEVLRLVVELSEQLNQSGGEKSTPSPLSLISLHLCLSALKSPGAG